MIDLSTLVGISSALSEQYGVPVSVGGSGACTGVDDKGRKFVKIPALDCDDEEYYEACRGYIDHEAGHLRFTDLSALPRSAAPMLKGIVNSLEDVYVEREMSALYRGCRTNFDKLLTKVFASEPFEPVGCDEVMKHLNAVDQYILLTARAMDAPVLTPNRDLTKAYLDNHLPGLTDALAPEIKVGSSTAENIETANKLFEVVKRYLDMPTKRGTSQSWEASDDSDEEAQGEVKKMKKWTTGKMKTAMRKRMETAEVDTGELDQLLSRLAKIKAEHGAHLVGSSQVADAADGFYRVNRMSDYDVLQAGQTSIAMRSRLEGLLQAEDLVRSWSGRRGRVDTKRLARLRVGDDRIFKRLWVEKKVNTEVIILCDATGSMGGSKASLTDRSLYAVMQTLQNIHGVDAALYHFSDNTVLKVLGFGAALHRQVAISPSGGTLLGSSMLRCYQEFRPARYGRRRLLITLTDGDTFDSETMPTVIQVGRKLGIELVMIGIQEDSVKEYTDDYKVVNKLEELPMAMFDILSRKLLRRVA